MNAGDSLLDEILLDAFHPNGGQAAIANVLKNLNIECDTIDVVNEMVNQVVERIERENEENVESHSTNVKKPRTVAKRKREARCKLKKTIFSKSAQFMAKTGQAMIVLVQDIRGDWEMLGSPHLERKVLSMQPLVDTRTETVFVDDELKPLSLKPADLPKPKSPVASSSGLTGVITSKSKDPVDFHVNRQGTTYSAKGADIAVRKVDKDKLFKVKATPKFFPKNTRKKTKSKHINKENTNKAPKRRRRTSKSNSTLVEGASNQIQSDTTCPTCQVEWEEMEGDRAVCCTTCATWWCGKCSQTNDIPQKQMNILKWYCQKCR